MAAHPDFLWTDLFRPRKGPQHTVADALHKNILFATLSKAELRYLSTLVYERTYLPEEPVFQQNERGVGLYVITQGKIAIKTTHSDGEEVFVTELGEGSFFGELSLVDADNVRTASAYATEKTSLVGFFKPDLMALLESRPEMGVKVLYQLSNVLGRRLKETTDKITRLSRALKAERS